MSPNVYNKEKILATNDRIWELRALKNYTTRQIAKEMDMAQSTIVKRLQKMSVEYAKAHLAKLDIHKTMQVVDLQRCADEAWNAWIQSKEILEIRTVSEHMHPETGAIIKTESIQYRPSNGNSLFLKEYRAALADIREILGINAALELNVNVRTNDEHKAALSEFVDALIVANAKTNPNGVAGQAIEKH